MPDARGIWKIEGHCLTYLHITGGRYKVFQAGPEVPEENPQIGNWL